jgi:hypothetical protein
MRYFQPAQSQYISDYTPLPLDTMYKVGQDLVSSDQAAADALASASKAFNITGGYRSQEAAKKLSEQYNAEASRIADELASNTIDSKTAARRINTLTNSFNTSEQKKLIDYDAAKSAQVQKYITAPGAEKDLLMDAYVLDPETGQRRFTPLTGIEKFEDIDRGYNALLPSDAYKELQPMFKDIAPQILENESSYNRFVTENGNLTKEQLQAAEILGPGVIKVLTEKGAKQIRLTDDMVRNQVRDYVDANFDRTDMNHFLYGRKRGDFNTKKDWEDFIVKQFVGNKDDSSTSSKSNTDIILSKNDSGRKGSHPKGDDFVSNPLATSTVTVTGNSFEYVNPISGVKESVPNATDFYKKLVKTDDDIKTEINRVKDNFIEVVGGVYSNIDSSGHTYLTYDGPDNIIASKVNDENLRLKTIQIDQSLNERLYLNAVDAVRAAGYKNFDPSKINITDEDKERARVKATKTDKSAYGMPNVGRTYIDEKIYNEELYKGKKDVELFNKLIAEQYDGIMYNDQTMIPLGDSSTDKSGKSQQVIEGIFNDVAGRTKYVNNAVDNKGLDEFWSKYDEDPKYKAVVDKAIKDQSYIRFEYPNNQFVYHVRVPNFDKSKSNYEIEIQSPENQALMETYANEHGYDSNFLAMGAKKQYSESLKQSNGLYGKMKGSDFDLDTELITTPITVKDINGDKQLKQGDTIFTLSDIPNVVFKPTLRNKLHLFHNDINEAKALMKSTNPEVKKEGEDKYNLVMRNLGAYGIETINNEGLYKAHNKTRRFRNLDITLDKVPDPVKKQEDNITQQKYNENTGKK